MTTPLSTFAVGDRVNVRPEHDDLLRILGKPTRTGTVSEVYVYPDRITIVVDEDSADGVEGGGSCAPYEAHQLVHAEKRTP